MRDTRIVSPQQHARGESLLDCYSMPAIKLARFNKAAREAVFAALLLVCWLYSTGIEQLRQFSSSVAALHFPAGKEMASFVLLALALSLSFSCYRRLTSELKTLASARRAALGIDAWLQMLRKSKSGLTVNAIQMSDTGSSMAIELFGVTAEGKPAVLCMSAQNYSTSYDRTVYTNPEVVMLRMLQTFPAFPTALVERLLSPSNLPAPHKHA